MRNRLIALFWSFVACGTIMGGLYFHQLFLGPTLQFNYNRVTGAITTVVPGGAAERAGIRAGDVVQSINGSPGGRGATPLYFTRVGDAVPVVVTRGGVTRATRVIAQTNGSTVARDFRAGGGATLSAINVYMVVPLNLWMMLLGIILLVLRPDDSAARVSALSLIAWAGGYFLSGTAPGIGATLAPLPPAARAAVFVIDASLAALFFAFCLNFALIFASEPDKRPKTWMRVAAFIVILPIMIESLRDAFVRMNPSPAAHGPAADIIYETLGPLLLVVSLVILATRFVRMTDRNARRRIGLIFIALLPGTLGFVVQVLIDRANGGFAAQQVGRLFAQSGTIGGSAIYAYAVVRHRMYDIRFLVRRSIRYALARGTLFAAMSLPLIGLVVFLYNHRNESLASIAGGTPAVYFFVIIPLIVVIRYRARLLEWLDRRYFREQYDARRLLLHLISVVRDGSDMFGLSRVALDEIDKALHPKHLAIWRISADGNEFQRDLTRGDVPSDAPPLANTGALPSLLAADAEPFDVFSRHHRPLLKRLPQAERDWIRATGAYLLVPLLIDQRLVGFVVLGERMSEEPYSHEDRDLLRTIAAQLALTFDYSRLKESPSLVWTPATRTPVTMADDMRSCPRCGRCYGPDREECEIDRAKLSREEGVPQIIEDKYIVTRVLGRGGMGSVYLANQKRLNRPVAVKVLLSHLVSSSTMRARFEREARIVARLKHPAIVMIHDFGVLGTNHAYLVMEYLEGQTLRKSIARGPMSGDDVLRILAPVCDAVDTAHRAGVVHRDLKPENIMIIGESETRVLDFGLARMTGPIADDEATLVQSGQSVGVVGTLLYLAPEVLSGIPADTKADQYSLGLMVYEMLAGRHPFGDATDLAAIVHAQTREMPPPLHEVVSAVPERVSLAVARAIAKEPAARFDSVAQFMDELGFLTHFHRDR